MDGANGHDERTVTQLFSWLSVDRLTGTENISAILREETWMPLVAKHERTMRNVREAVESLASATGCIHRLVRISLEGRTVLDEVHPHGVARL